MCRLTERKPNGDIVVDGEYIFHPHTLWFNVADKLSCYEDLEVAGRLIELPCKVGDEIWYIKEVSSYTPTYHTYHIYSCFRVEYIEITKHGIAFGRDGSGMFADQRFYTKDIGKTVFLTKEEAEKVLAELKKEEQ